MAILPRSRCRARSRGQNCCGGRGCLRFLFILTNILIVQACLNDGNTTNDTDKPITKRDIEKQILDTVLDKDRYDNKIRPDGINGSDATVVHINMFIRSIARIDDVMMEYSVQLTFREEWVDERLRFDNFNPKPPKELQYLTLTNTSQIWMPDLFFSNERRGHLHNIVVPNVYIRIHPNGSILYSNRISLTLACPMILKMFPLDKQVCPLRMASYGWTKDDLIFQWKDVRPVQITPNLHLPRFVLEQFSTDYCDSVTNTGAYSCLKVDLLFKRQFSYYLVQVYIPSCMLVIVSWVSFWLDPDSVPARVPLGVTTLLTMVAQTSGINMNLPPVSYIKALDVWTGVCLTFVFGALLEFAFVNYISRKDKQRAEVLKERQDWFKKNANRKANRRIRIENNRPLNSMWQLNLDHDEQCPFHCKGLYPSNASAKTWLASFSSKAKRIDVIARIIFPLLFLFFNLAYWSAYVLREGDVLYI